MNSLSPTHSSSSQSYSSHPDVSLSANSHTPSKPARRSFFSSPSFTFSPSPSLQNEARSSVALSGPRPSSSYSTASTATQPAARPPSQRSNSTARSTLSGSVHSNPSSYKAIFGKKSAPGGVNLAANLAFGGTQRSQHVTVSRVRGPKTVDVTHRRHSSISSEYSTTSTGSSSNSEYSFLPITPTKSADAGQTLKPFAKKNRQSVDIGRPSIQVPQSIAEAPESTSTTVVPTPAPTSPDEQALSSASPLSPHSPNSPGYFEPKFGNFAFDFSEINTQKEYFDLPQEQNSPEEESARAAAEEEDMGLVRNFTLRSKRDAAPQRPQISLPLNLISTTNTASFNAPDIAEAQKQNTSPSTATSSGRSGHSSVDESDNAAITEPNLTDASSVASSLSSSPVEHKSLTNYFSPLTSRKQEPATRIVDSTDETISVRGSASENEIAPPALPQRAPSHSKNEHMRLSRIRSVRRSGTEQRDFAADSAHQSVEYNADDDDSSPETSPRSRQHPFSQELEQLDEVAEEFSASATAAMDEEDEKIMEEQGLVKFSVDDYLLEIRQNAELWYPDSPAVLRQEEEGWI